MIPARQRVRAEWLGCKPTQGFFAAFAAGGFCVRAVGGAVRNTLLGLPVTDIDMATDASPADVLRIAQAAGFKTIPTGLAHGTVTVIAHSQAFEVTTLRRDVATDGRHAEVAFTTDWAADARRRDFTINALYCDADGAIFDPLGGVRDLEPVQVRFIGEPVARIREDYLRILRFFRFTAVYTGDGVLDAEGLAACSAARAGLAQISGERIQVELYKLLAARHAGRVTAALVESGVFGALVDVTPRAGDLERFIAIEARLGIAPDPVRRLAALAIGTAADAGVLDRRLKLSGEHRGRLSRIAAHAREIAPGLGERKHRELGYRWGLRAYEDAALVAWARSGATVSDADWRNTARLGERFTPPVLPVSGRDLVALGFAPGPRLGDELAVVEAHWIALDFSSTREALLAYAQSHVQDSKS